MSPNFSDNMNMDTIDFKKLSEQLHSELLRVNGWRKVVRTGSIAAVSYTHLDPGFGFGKTLEHNYELMAHLEEFSIFELPLLVGVSRKSMIYKLLGGTPQDSLNGTTVLDTVALMKGANILRVHDVREAVEAVRIVDKLRTESEYGK